MGKELKTQIHMGDMRRDYSYDIIRSILVILVILGHSDFYQIKTAFGGIYLADNMKLYGVHDTPIHGYIRTLSALIYSFHMPTFIALSGALYNKYSNKYKTFGELISEKARNLLFPYVIVWICWNIPIKLLAGYYNDIPIWKWLVQMVVPYNVYLWFLLSLFIVFVLTYSFDKIKNTTISLHIIVVVVAFGVSLICQRVLGMYIPIGNPLKYWLWFEIGRLFEKRKSNHSGMENGAFRKYLAWCSVAVFLIAFYVSQHVSHLGWMIRDTICPFTGLLFLWIITNNVATGLTDTNKKMLLIISSYSMGLYLYAEPINYLVLSMAEKICGIEFFGTNIGTITIFFSRIFLSVFISILITRSLRKGRIRIRLY